MIGCKTEKFLAFLKENYTETNILVDPSVPADGCVEYFRIPKSIHDKFKEELFGEKNEV